MAAPPPAAAAAASDSVAVADSALASAKSAVASSASVATAFATREQRTADATQKRDTGGTSSSAPTASFPPICTDVQRAVVSQVKPMLWTACPDPTWLLDDNEQKEGDPKVTNNNIPSSTILFEPSLGRRPLGISVGCNKGIDAVQTLRFLSQDPIYDKSAWIEALNVGPVMIKGVCGADASPQVELPASTYRKARPATVHCMEAMPSTYRKLKNASHHLRWDESFIVHHAAASDSNGIIPFPNKEGMPGYESLGIDDCQNDTSLCQNVTLYTLDTFFQTKVEPKLLASNKAGRHAADHHRGAAIIVDYLSIDVEGFDIAVLRGGPSTLQKTKYIEFEVHNKGVWPETPLATAIASLKEQNFCCYYAGQGGKLWRLTDCMTGPGFHIFSNVACVNVQLAPNLAQRMENIFLQTIAAD